MATNEIRNGWRLSIERFAPESKKEDAPNELVAQIHSRMPVILPGYIPTKLPKVSQARDFGTVGCPSDADPLDTLLIRLFNRVQ
jgi:hypothetical protein